MRDKPMPAHQVDNDLYRRMGHAWWDESEGAFATIRFFINPVRFAYFSRILAQESVAGAPTAARVLDIGCGGGFLSEDFARIGFRVTGIDPAEESIAAARRHAGEAALDIEYRTGCGENLPFPDGHFEIVLCCDVLEHVEDVDRVLGEVARVLRPGGLFFYDTLNRTLISKLAVIKVMQEWRSTAFAADNAHVWNKFLKPAELFQKMSPVGLANREIRGIASRRNPFSNWLNFRRRVQGKIDFRELGRRLAFQESGDTSVSYMGYAIKES